MSQSADELLGQLRDVTGPLPAPPLDGLSVWLGLAAAVAGIVVAVWIARRWRRPMPPPHPAVEAASALEELASEPDPAALADFELTVRRFLGRTHGLAVESLTSAELTARLPEAGRKWATVIAEMEPARYSNATMPTAAWHELIARAQQLIAEAVGDPAGPGGR